MGFERKDHGVVHDKEHDEVCEQVCHGKDLEHHCSLVDELDMVLV